MKISEQRATEKPMILKAFFPEVPIYIDAKACAGVTPETHQNALNAMKMCQIKIINE